MFGCKIGRISIREWHPRRYATIYLSFATKIEPKTPPRRSKTRQYAPGCPKGRLKLPPSDPTTRPGRLQRRPQDALRGTQDAARHTQDAPMSSKSRPDLPQTSILDNFGDDFEWFCVNFWGSWKRFWIDFSNAFWLDFKVCSRRASVHRSASAGSRSEKNFWKTKILEKKNSRQLRGRGFPMPTKIPQKTLKKPSAAPRNFEKPSKTCLHSGFGTELSLVILNYPRVSLRILPPLMLR